MIITSHSVEKFRNIGSVSFIPHPEMNIVYGENGQGKTNIIESIWLMTGFYSFRTRKNIHLVQSGEQQARIETSFYSQQREQQAIMTVDSRKELELNGIKEESPRAMMGKFYAVVFTPNTLSIVRDGPSERRRMLDVAISLVKPNYAAVTSRYIQTLKHRNALLKKYAQRPFADEYFIPWNEEMARLGARIIKYRLDYIEKFSAVAGNIYDGISSGREKLTFRYDFSAENMTEDEIKQKLLSELERTKESDLRRLYTASGPHSHDLLLYLDGKEASVYGSQGQQRSCAIAMKLGEASIIEKITGECPAVLLDDVMSELDEGRQKYILNYLNNWQVFITCCDPSQLLRSEKGKTFEVKGGRINELE